MQGIVLGFDGATGVGVVRGEDGSRYKFLLKDWRGTSSPKAQDSVDFEANGVDATEIFLLKRSAAIDMSALSDNATKLGGQMKAALADETKRKALANGLVRSNAAQFPLRRPALVLAGMILLGCFAPFVSAFGKSFSLWAVMGFVSDAVDSLNQIGAVMTMGGPRAPSNDGSLFLAKAAPRCLYLLYAIPICAGQLIYKELTGATASKYRTRTALAGFFSPVAALSLMALLLYLAMPKELLDTAGSLSRSPYAPPIGRLNISITDFLGWGLYLVWISSGLLLAINMGLINPATALRAQQKH